MNERMLERYEGDPRFLAEDGYYYFWDENWTIESGPYPTLEDCNRALTAYGKQLNAAQSE
jgi:hypothetical protein